MPAHPTSAELAITDHPLLSTILLARGVRTRSEAEAFLSPAKVPLADPLLLPDVERAVELIRAAIAAGDRIGIFGDYDVDGLTSTALLTRALRRLGSDPLPMIPNRLTDAYGLTTNAVDTLAAAGVSLLITVDCGSSNAAEIAHAQRVGMRCIILDHHHLGEPLPQPNAFVSPRHPENRYPEPYPAAVGVVWTVVRALLGDADAEMYLPYVALGTIADIVDLRGQNRTLVTRGISKLRRWQLPGIRALCVSADVEQSRLSTWDVGYILAPRLNAAGRMETPQIALDLLLADTPIDAAPLAERLSTLNHVRRADTQRITDEAVQMIAAYGWRTSAAALVVADPSWSVGIVGIVAGRLAERYHRPVFVLEQGEAVSKGSGRGGGAIDLVEALRPQADLLERYGGHAHAAGLTIRTDNIEAFRERLCATVFGMAGGAFPGRSVQSDAVAAFDDLTLDMVNLFDRLEPFGAGNPYPRLLVRNVGTHWEKTSADGRTLMFSISDQGRRKVSAIYFGAGERLPELRAAGRIDLVGELRRDEWNGQVRAKFYVEDFRAAQ